LALVGQGPVAALVVAFLTSWARNDPVPATRHHRQARPDHTEDQMVHLQPRTRTVLAWCWWLATFGCCAAGLVGALVVTRPLTVGVLSNGAGYALVFPLGYATVGLVLSLRRPANPIGWLYAASGLAWSLNIPGWSTWSVAATRCRRPPSSPP
jgi:hypothetical protein